MTDADANLRSEADIETLDEADMVVVCLQVVRVINQHVVSMY